MSNSASLREIEERTNLTANNMFELLLFYMGESNNQDNSARRELFGINVFKVREIMVMPKITAMANAPAHFMGIADIRGQMIPVVNLPMVCGCTPSKGLGILLVTEFSRSTQAFAVEEVNEIVRLEWNQVLSAENTGGGLVTSIARLKGDTEEEVRLAQVLDVEQILRDLFPKRSDDVHADTVMPATSIPPGSVILAADDSAVARMMIEQGLNAMNIEYVMTKTGKEAWERLQEFQKQADAEGKSIKDKVAMVLTDLEMPEMDGFTLTRNIKQDARFKSIPVIIHSSLTGTTNEGHVKSVGADAYVAKFVAEELGAAIHKVLTKVQGA
jgi:two-component system, chemotaxis family, chemotaxis protein CheV